MANAVYPSGQPINMTATGNVYTGGGALLGFYVNSTSSGTIAFKKGGSGGTAISGTITPAIGFHFFPAAVADLHATIGGTLNVTLFFIKT